MSQNGGRQSLQGQKRDRLAAEIDLTKPFTFSFWVAMPLDPARTNAIKLRYDFGDDTREFIYFQDGKVNVELSILEPEIIIENEGTPDE